ncbi:hypothetical protein L6452_12004 [Arctium lappa]|uniref:Uncharacterized protein n=1 Tax=Arctium lappa TaxID=4217 RepID=A0ACB9DQ86_ARCLA|nr:hypothetical protein L6452_12004 [Arctium lappa]
MTVMSLAALLGLVSDVLRSLASTAFQEIGQLRSLKASALKDTYTLAATAFQEIGRLRSLKADVSTLKYTYMYIQDVLNDVEVKQRGQKDVQKWLSSLRSSSLEVKNILDEEQNLCGEDGPVLVENRFMAEPGGEDDLVGGMENTIQWEASRRVEGRLIPVGGIEKGGEDDPV